MPDFPKIASFKTVDAFRARLRELAIELPADDRALSAVAGSPLAQALPIPGSGRVVGNRLAIHPMEGWDGTTTGEPSEHTLRRWRHFGQSGAKLIWGGEAFAVTGDGRANPNQLGVVDGDNDRAERGVRKLLDELRTAHREHVGSTDDLLVGLQLTHSGRYCRPRDKSRPEPRIAYHHPLLDRRLGIAPDDDAPVVCDDYLQRLIDAFIVAARLAERAGFDFVDVKHCHGYLAHELLSAFTRPGRFGGSFENRTRFGREVIDGIRAACPRLLIGVRLSAFDAPPYSAQSAGGEPEDGGAPPPGRFGYGCAAHGPSQIDLAEPIAFLRLLESQGVRMFNITGASPYTNPHLTRPAAFPPSDGYAPPEDPLVGVNRHIQVTRQLKQACPQSLFVGTAYTYLQEYFPHVAQATVRAGWCDCVGIGRMVLSYWDLPADLLQGRPLQFKRLCRTFSDCTTAPRNGLISGCYPLDEHYRRSEGHQRVKAAKRQQDYNAGIYDDHDKPSRADLRRP